MFNVSHLSHCIWFDLVLPLRGLGQPEEELGWVVRSFILLTWGPAVLAALLRSLPRKRVQMIKGNVIGIFKHLIQLLTASPFSKTLPQHTHTHAHVGRGARLVVLFPPGENCQSTLGTNLFLGSSVHTLTPGLHCWQSASWYTPSSVIFLLL